jgi:hypothetical protein
MRHNLARLLRRGVQRLGDLFGSRELFQQLKFKRLATRAGIPTAWRVGEVLFQTDRRRGLAQWEFHDETWSVIQRRLTAGGMEPVPELPQVPRELGCDDGTIVVRARTERPYKLLLLYLDPETHAWTDISWETTARRDTPFRELVFSLRYKDFDNRYRYRLDGDRLYFDKVKDGTYEMAIASTPCPMIAGRWYHLRIEASRDVFRCYIDGVLKLSNRDPDHARGAISVSCWENDGATDIRAAIGPMVVRRLVPDEGRDE